MRTGFNARLLGSGQSYRRAGVSRYIEQLLDALPTAQGDDEVIVVGRPGDTAGSLPDRLLRHPAGRIVWEQTALPLHARNQRWDLIHSPVNVVPLASTVPTTVTVHDLAFARTPETIPAKRRAYLFTMTRLSVMRARRVLAVSESTADDLQHLFRVPASKIRVTPLAADARFRRPSPDAVARFRAANELERPYILSVGTREPRKNIARLVSAFGMIADTIPHELILVGPAGWMGAELDRAIADLPAPVRSRVRLTGFVDDAELPLWYGAADVFVYPALHEGFGLPVLEAMACGTPVITSRRSSLPEVAGDAAMLIRPEAVDEIAEAIRTIVGTPALAGTLRQRGQERARAFSWSTTARLTVAAWREAAND